MNRDDFIEGMKKQYIEEIHELLLECEENRGKKVNYDLLNSKIEEAQKAAKLDGIDVVTFVEWITDAIPEHSEFISICQQGKMAA